MTDERPILWSVGHNITGYLPEADVYGTLDWEQARTVLLNDLETFESSISEFVGTEGPESEEERFAFINEQESAAKAIKELKALEPRREFTAYTDRGTDHSLPTAWWIQGISVSRAFADGFHDGQAGTVDPAVDSTKADTWGLAATEYRTGYQSGADYQ